MASDSTLAVEYDGFNQNVFLSKPEQLFYQALTDF
jgi:hypothetical protein